MFTDISTMTTAEVADMFTTLCRAGHYLEAVTELFAPEVESVEPEGGLWPQRTQGYDRVLQKTRLFMEMVESVRHSTVGDPVVSGEHFSMALVLEAELRGGGHLRIEGVCVYQVKDGLIVLEQFFYPPMH